MGFRIDSERLYIRPPHEDDADAMRLMTRDPEMMRYLNAGEPMPDSWITEARERQLGNLAEFGFCMGSLVLREDDTVIGIGGLQPMRGSGEFETGWWVSPTNATTRPMWPICLGLRTRTSRRTSPAARLTAWFGRTWTRVRPCTRSTCPRWSGFDPTSL